MSLGDEKDIVNAGIIHIVDPYTKSKYEEQLNYDELPKWSDCVKALDRRYQHVSAEEASWVKGKSFSETTSGSKKITRNSYTCSRVNNTSDPKCLYCKSNHCQGFSGMPVLDRFNFAKMKQLYINCLNEGHRVFAQHPNIGYGRR